MACGQLAAPLRDTSRGGDCYQPDSIALYLTSVTLPSFALPPRCPSVPTPRQSHPPHRHRRASSSAGTDCAVRLLTVPPLAPSLTNPAPHAPTTTLRGHSAFVSAVAALTHDHALSADLEGQCVLWDLNTKSALRSWAGHTGGVGGILLAKALGGGGNAPSAAALERMGAASASSPIHLTARSASSDGSIHTWKLTIGGEEDQAGAKKSVTDVSDPTAASASSGSLQDGAMSV